MAPSVVWPPSKVLTGLAQHQFAHLCLVLGDADSDAPAVLFKLPASSETRPVSDHDGWRTESALVLKSARCDEFLNRIDGACQYERAVLSCTDAGATDTTFGLSSSMCVAADDHFVQNSLFAFVPGKGNAINVRVQTRDEYGSSMGAPLRYNVNLQPLSFTLDGGIVARLEHMVTLMHTGDGDIDVGSDRQHEDTSLELVLHCESAVGRLHFMLPGSTIPYVEYLQCSVQQLVCKWTAETELGRASVRGLTLELCRNAARPVVVFAANATGQGQDLVVQFAKSSQQAVSNFGSHATRHVRGNFVQGCLSTAERTVSIALPQCRVHLSSVEYVQVVALLSTLSQGDKHIRAPQPEPEVCAYDSGQPVDHAEAQLLTQQMFDRAIAALCPSASSIHVTAPAGTICLHGQYRREVEDDAFNPYDGSDSDSDADEGASYAYTAKFDGFQYFSATGVPEMDGEVPSYTSVSFDAIVIEDDLCRNAIVKSVGKSGESTAIAVDLFCDSDGTQTSVYECTGLLGVCPEWLPSVQNTMPALNLPIGKHLSDFFGSSEAAEQFSPVKVQYIVNLQNCSALLRAPLASSAARLQLGSLSLHWVPHQQQQLSCSVHDATLQLSNHARWEALEELWHTNGRSCEVRVWAVRRVCVRARVSVSCDEQHN